MSHRPRLHRPPWRAPVIVLLLLLGAATGVTVARRLLPQPQFSPIGPRAEFAPAACVVDTASTANHGPTVFIDPGHGGPDPGVGGTTAGGGPITEKEESLSVALQLMRFLTHAGYRVALSRVTDTSVAALKPGTLSGAVYSISGEHADLEARIDCANASRASLLLSIHFDGFTDPTVGGTATLYDDARAFTAQNLRFAQDVQAAVLATWSTHGINVPDRGVVADSQAGTPALTPQGAEYGHLLLLGPAAPGWLVHPTQMPGALSEPLFLTDPGEAALADSALGHRLLTQAYVAAIGTYFKRVSAKR